MHNTKLSRSEERGLWFIGVLMVALICIQVGIAQGRQYASSDRNTYDLVERAH